jgi:hypothetical protein
MNTDLEKSLTDFPLLGEEGRLKPLTIPVVGEWLSPCDVWRRLV